MTSMLSASKRTVLVPNKRTYARTIHDPVYDPPPNNPPDGLHSRIRRAAGSKLHEFVENLKLMRGITNAISLQSSLIDGTLDVDKMIGAILHMGKLTPQQIDAMKSEDVQKAVNGFMKLPNELKGDDETKKTEDVLLLREQTRLTLETIGNVVVKEKDDYLQSLDNMNQVTMDSAKLEDVIGALETLNPFLKKIELFKSDTDATKAKEDKSYMGDIVRNIDRFSDVSKSFAAVMESMKNLKDKSVDPNFFTPFLEHFKAQNTYKSEQLFKTKPDKAKISSNLATLKNVGTVLQPVQSSLNQLKELTKSRQKQEHVTGVPSGAEDLSDLTKDSNEEWLRKITGMTLPQSAALGKHFGAMKNFTTELNSVETKWKPTVVDGIVEKTEKLVEETGRIGTFGDVNQPLGVLAGCDESKLTDPGNHNTDDMVTPMKALHAPIDKLESHEKLKYFNNLTALIEKFKTDNLDEKDVPNKVKELKNDEDVAAAVENFKKLEEDLKGFRGFMNNTRTDLVNGVKNITSQITTFTDEVTTSSYAKYFDCLKTVTEGGKIKESIDLIRETRGMDVANMQKAVDAFNSILGSKDALKKAKQAGLDLKGQKKMNSAVKKLMEKKENLVKFDSAVQGMVTVEKLVEMKAEMDQFMGDVDNIMQAAESHQKDLQKVDYDRLKTLGTVKTDLAKMYTEISVVVTAIDGFEGETLKSYDAIFQAASKINKVTVDVSGMIESLKALKNKQRANNQSNRRKRANPNLDQSITTLNSLSTLNLDFTSFNFASGTTPLDQIAQFFDNFKQSFSTLNNPSNPPAQVTPGSAVGQFALTTPASDDTMVYIGGGIGGLVLIAIIAAVLMFLRRRKKKAEEKKGKTEKEQKKSEKENTAKPASIAKAPETQKLLSKSKKEDKEKPGETKSKTGSSAPPAKVAEKKEDKEVERLRNIMMAPPTEAEQQEATEALELHVTQSSAAPEADGLQLPQPAADQQVVLGTGDYYALLYAVVASYQASYKGHKLTPYGWAQMSFLDEKVRFSGAPAEDTYLSERRYQNPGCKKITQVKLEGFTNPGQNNYINASRASFKDGDWILAQGPQDEHEDEPDKISTMEKHWAMIDQNNVGAIVQLCQFREIRLNKHYEPDPKEKQVCGKYYPEVVGETMQFGRYKVKTLEVADVSGRFNENKDMFSLLKMEYTNSQDEKSVPKTVDILRFTGWPPTDTPPSPRNALDIIAFCDSYKKNVVILCADGAGRSGTLLAIKMGIILSLGGKRPGVATIISRVRSIRHGAIGRPAEVFYFFVATIRGIMDKLGEQLMLEMVDLTFVYDCVKTGRLCTVNIHEHPHRDRNLETMEERDELLKKTKKVIEKNKKKEQATTEATQEMPSNAAP